MPHTTVFATPRIFGGNSNRKVIGRGLRLLRDELLEAKSNLLKTSRDRKVT